MSKLRVDIIMLRKNICLFIRIENVYAIALINNQCIKCSMPIKPTTILKALMGITSLFVIVFIVKFGLFIVQRL